MRSDFARSELLAITKEFTDDPVEPGDESGREPDV